MSEKFWEVLIMLTLVSLLIVILDDFHQRTLERQWKENQKILACLEIMKTDPNRAIANLDLCYRPID